MVLIFRAVRTTKPKRKFSLGAFDHHGNLLLLRKQLGSKSVVYFGKGSMYITQVEVTIATLSVIITVSKE